MEMKICFHENFHKSHKKNALSPKKKKRNKNSLWGLFENDVWWFYSGVAGTQLKLEFFHKKLSFYGRH